MRHCDSVSPKISRLNPPISTVVSSKEPARFWPRKPSGIEPTIATCAHEDKTWSIYCAFHRASVDVSGGFHHRRPTLQIARAILYERVAEERKKGRKYPHILADYNNDPTTRFADVQSLFGDVATRMKR